MNDICKCCVAWAQSQYAVKVAEKRLLEMTYLTSANAKNRIPWHSTAPANCFIDVLFSEAGEDFVSSLQAKELDLLLCATLTEISERMFTLIFLQSSSLVKK